MSTIEEYFSGKKLDVLHFRILGSLVYFHVTKSARKNIERVAQSCIFVGYIDRHQNYWMYLQSQRVTMVLRVLTFNQEKVMRCYHEREIQLHGEDDILAPKEEP